MVKFSKFLIVLFFVICFGAATSPGAKSAKSLEEELPAKPTRLVNNLSLSFPNFLKVAEASALENKLANFANSSGAQIAILIVDDLLDLDPNDYTTRLFNKWGIGDKTNHGILILIKPTNPRVIYINTGYGSEGYLPDASAKQIIEQILKPNFKQGFYYQGLDQATSQIISAFGTDLKKSPREKNPLLLLITLVIFMVFIIVSNEMFNKKRSSLTLRSKEKHHSDSLLPFIFGYGLGGGFGGGHRDNDHFGGFGGGGFGGFGGGMSGGGGAGGSW